MQQYVVVTAPVFEDGAQTNGLSRGIRSISAIHILLCITLSVVSVTETKQRPSVSQVKLSFVQRWQKHCNAREKERFLLEKKSTKVKFKSSTFTLLLYIYYKNLYTVQISNFITLRMSKNYTHIEVKVI